MALLTTVGQPDDSVGVAGDIAIDTRNHFCWGPKTTTWAGTAFSMTGPTGPGILTGQGAPAAGTGVPGNAYVDLLTGDVWGPKATPTSWPATPASRIAGAPGKDGVAGKDGANGQDGAPGVSMLTSQSVGLGPSFSCTVPVSTTPVLGTYPGSTQSVTFVPTYGTALMGLSYTNVGGTLTLALVDTTAGATIYSVTATGNLTSFVGQFAVDQYPMPANHQYVWQITSATAATGNIWIQPMYLFPAASPTYNVSSLGMAARTNATFNSTAVVLNAGASSTGLSFKFPKAASIYAITVNSTNTAALTLVLTNGTVQAIALTVPASAVTTFGPYALNQYVLTANSQYYWTVKGSGTGSIFVDAQILFSIA